MNVERNHTHVQKAHIHIIQRERVIERERGGRERELEHNRWEFPKSATDFHNFL